MAITKAQERGFWKKKIADLEKQNKELQEENKHIYERMTRIDKVLNEKNEQIEKMKNFLNCKHHYKQSDVCKKGNGYCICEYWELAE